jgi:hypothetical protein
LITKCEVYFSRISQLNDPFEFRWRDKIPTDPAEIDYFIRELCAKNFPCDTVEQRRARFERLKQQLLDMSKRANGKALPTLTPFTQGVFCASEIWSDILMWSHYAANHTGVCVSIRTDSAKGRLFFPVMYSEQVPVISYWAYVNPERGLFIDLARTKAHHWRYEKEWRTIHSPGVHVFNNCVDRVVLGASMTDKDKQAVREAAAKADHEIEVYESRLSNSRYSLEFPGMR